MKVFEFIFDDVLYYFDCVYNFNLFFVVDFKRVNVCCKVNVNFKDLIMFFFLVVWFKMMFCVIEEKFVNFVNDIE